MREVLPTARSPTRLTFSLILGSSCAAAVITDPSEALTVFRIERFEPIVGREGTRGARVDNLRTSHLGRGLHLEADGLRGETRVVEHNLRGPSASYVLASGKIGICRIRLCGI